MGRAVIHDFGQTAAGTPVQAIEIASYVLSVRILTLGAILQDVRFGPEGPPLTLGSPDVAAYEGPLASFGSIMGPVVNRIRDAQAVIDGQLHQFEANFEGQHTLHSGSTGMQHLVWEITDASPTSVSLRLEMPDGQGGFPGNRVVQATYAVEGNALTLSLRGTSDAPTLWNLANHAYWSLDGQVGFSGHKLRIAAEHFLEAGADLMPTGQKLRVEGSAVDASSSLVLSGDTKQFLDLNYCLSEDAQPLRDVCWLTSPGGQRLTVATTETGLQIYDCGTIDGAGFATYHGKSYGPYSGLAIEAQGWPGATSHPQFPRIEYAGNEAYVQKTQWRFDRTP